MNTTTKTTTPALETSPAATPVRMRTRTDRLQKDIAALPKDVRDMINHMLDDGLPYRVLIDELGEAGEGLDAQKLADWVQGRYQDYLKDCETIERAKTRMEFASDLIRELGAVDPALIYRACSTVAALQILQAMLDYGDEALREMLQTKPTGYITM